MDDNLVYFDQLTHCHSRYYYDNVVKEKYNNKLCYVIYVDINNLKSINDKYGHCKGTELIKDTSNITVDDVQEGRIFKNFPKGVTNVIYSIDNKLPTVIFNWRGDSYMLSYEHGKWGLGKKHDKRTYE